MTDRDNYGIGRRVIQNKEFIFTSGTHFGSSREIFYSKFQIEELGLSDYYQNVTISWSNISASHVIENVSPKTDAIYNTSYSVNINTPTIAGNDILNGTPSLNITQKYKALLFNDKHNQSFRENQKEIIELEKG